MQGPGDVGLAGLGLQPRLGRLHNPDEREPRAERRAEDRPQRPCVVQCHRVDLRFSNGLLRRPRGPSRAPGFRGADQQRLHLQSDGPGHRARRLRELAADLHDPGQRVSGVGCLPRQADRLDGQETAVVFTVRDDSSHSKLLYVLPDASYQAYNTFGGKSLYFGTEGGNTVAGTSRAVKVSFNRPLAQAGRQQNWFFGPDFDLLQWLEKQGYDVSYTDDV